LNPGSFALTEWGFHATPKRFMTAAARGFATAVGLARDSQGNGKGMA
jgi:hypothetical protein